MFFPSIHEMDEKNANIPGASPCHSHTVNAQQHNNTNLFASETNQLNKNNFVHGVGQLKESD